jgi:hypothetical protein
MTIERNLVIVHTQDFQDVADFQEIARTVRELAPDIEVFIASNTIPSSATRRQASRRPSLIFSPGQLLNFRPLRGRVYAGCPIPKLEQLARFKIAGLPVPEFAQITPDLVLPENKFGPYVVIKPGFSLASHGHHMILMQRELVRFRPREAYPMDHPGRYGPMFVQRFIATGHFINHHRVLTLFGTPLLAFKTIAQKARDSLDSPHEILAQIPVKARRRDGPVGREFTWDADILDLARLTYSALPEIPLQGVDIIREKDSGKLFVLEANPGGNTWIFSKGDMTARLRAALGVERLADQFDGFRRAAEVLIERTRAEAE